ncbi:hypothetical protein Gpo141_00007116 [Globisporangium polare]
MGGDDPHFDMQDYLINWNAGPFGLVLRPELGSDMPPCVAQVLPEQSVAKLSGVRAGDMLISVNGKKTSKLGYEKVVKMLYKERLPVILHFRTPKGSSGRGGGSSNADASSTRDNINGTFATELQPSSRGRAMSSTPSMQRGQQQSHHPHPIQRPPPDFDSRSTTSTVTRAVPRGDPAQRERKQYTAVWENGSLGISFRPYSPRVNVPCVDFIGTRGVGRDMDRVCVNDVLIAINGEKTKALGVERVLRWLLVIEKPVVLRFHSSSNRVAHGQSNSIESYQPEYEPARGTTTTAKNNETPRLQILYDTPPPPPPPSPSLAPQQQKQQNDARHSQPTDARRLNNPSLNSYLASAHHQSGRPDQKERRYTNNALPRENQIALNSNARPQKPQPNSRGGPYRTEYVDLSVDTKPEMRRHQSTNLPSEYEQIRNGDRPRRYSNGSINLNQQGAVAPQTPSTRREERREPAVSYLSNDRLLYEPESPAPRDPELERPRQRRYSNANSIMSNAKAYGAGGKTPDSPDRYTRGQPAAGHYVPQQVPIRGAPSRNEELSFDEAVRIVVKSSGKPITEFVFGGVPILTIREGSPQAKLLFTYAKACLAKEKQAASPAAADVQRMRSNTTSSVVSSVTPTTDVRDAAALAGDFTRDLPPQPHYHHQQQQQRFTTGNTLGRHGSSQFLSYKFADESAKRTRTLSTEAPVLPPFRAPAQTHSPQVVAVVPPPPPVMMSAAASPLPPQAKQLSPTATPSDREVPSPSDDFISLKDFVVQGDGQVADRNTASSMNSASTHVHSVDSEDDLLTVGSQLVAPPVRQQSDNEVVASGSNQNQQEAFAFDRRALNNTDISISFKADEDKHPSSDMITLSDLTTNDMAVTTKPSGSEPETKKPVDPVVQKEINDVTHVEKSSLMHPLIAEMYGFLPDLHNIVKDKSVDTLLKKKGVLDEIQEILQSLQMEAQFERHSTLGVGALPSLPPHTLESAATSPPPQPSTRGKQCFQCGKTGELADLALEGGRRELYCQDCWEVFFFSEDHRLQEEETESVATSATPRSVGGGRDSTDDAYKYSFHDSSVSRSDMMIGPWRYLNGDGASSIRDSTTTIGSSITDRADEVWL